MSGDEIRIQFEGSSYVLKSGESALECLIRHGVQVDSYCRSGVCQSCVLRAMPGCREAIPKRAQVGLKESAKRAGVLLSCVCYPTASLGLERTEATARFVSRVARVQHLSASVLRVDLERPAGFEYQAGQFVQLERPEDGLMRPYSLASLPSDPHLELHVALLENGQMSSWLLGATGHEVTLKGPIGECCYVADDLDRPLMLAGTGTGLAPLLGVVRDAARAGHRGPIVLWHGARDPAGLYFASQLEQLCQRYPNLRATCCTLEAGEQPSGSGGLQWRVGALDQLLFSEHPKLDDHRLYFCGNPELVAKLKKRAYLAGAELARIHSDPFLPPQSTSG